MPYAIIRAIHNGVLCYAVKNTKTGKLHGYTTEEKAKAQMRLLTQLDQRRA